MELTLARIKKESIVINTIFVCMILTFIYKGITTLNGTNQAMSAWSEKR